MIITMFGTTWLTPDAFLDRYDETLPGRTFLYATGDLAVACQYHEEARDLRALVHRYTETGKILPTQLRRPDLPMKSGGVAFEYRATKRDTKKQGEG